MIVVDTSAVIAFFQGEEGAEFLKDVFAQHDLVICAGTYAELCLVASSRNFLPQVKSFMRLFQIQIAPISGGDVAGHTAAYEIWGKGKHPAGLNYGDCFAYALAKKTSAPLACIGNDFARTDLVLAS